MTTRADRSNAVRLDLNSPVFQRQPFALEKAQQLSALATLRKLSGMTWQQVYQDQGLKWEIIYSRRGPHGGRLYSLRISKGFRAVAYRDDDWMRFLSLHADHDSAYR